MHTDMFLEKFHAFLVKHQLLPTEGERHLLAVSGGLDSMCMVHAYHLSGFDFAVAHCNFGLRGTESDGDASFVEAWCREHGVDFFLENVATTEAATAPRVSIQMAARELRYAFFEKVRQKTASTYTATAHHRNDSIETALFNFSRGTSMAGLKGIPVKNAAVIRPMLGFSRAELLAFAEAEGIVWREDSSNAETKYSRNYIRHAIIPAFQAQNPQFLENAHHTMEYIHSDWVLQGDLLRYFFKHQLQQESDGSQTLSFDALAEMTQAVPVLHHWLSPFGFSREACQQMAFSMAQGTPGQHWDGGEHQLFRTRTGFSLVSKQPALPSTTIHADDIFLRLVDGTRLMIQKTRFFAPPYPAASEKMAADAQKLSFPLCLRPWKDGDKITPYGMDGKTQKVKDLLTNAKVNPAEKSKTLIIEDANGVLCWVVGHRISEHIRIEAGTEEVCYVWLEG